MGTLSDLKNRIATELARTDLTPQIGNAVADAVKFYARERFWFNQSRNITFDTVAGQQGYGEAANPIIPGLIRIDQIFFSSDKYPLTRYSVTDFEMVNSGQSGGGRPFSFTYSDSQILLYPIPNDVFTMRICGHYRLSMPEDDQSNAWTDDAEELIRTHAKQILYLDPLEDDQAAARMQVKLTALLDGLRGETSSRMGTGRIRPTTF